MILSWATFNLLKMFILARLNVNKWIVLAFALVIYFVGAILGLKGFLSLIVLFITLILVFWFIDLNFYSKPVSKKKEIKIRPKAKPNRLKKK